MKWFARAQQGASSFYPAPVRAQTHNTTQLTPSCHFESPLRPPTTTSLSPFAVHCLHSFVRRYIVSFGDALYRALDAVERLKAEGLDIGLINKVTLNFADEASLTKVGSTGPGMNAMYIITWPENVRSIVQANM